MPLRPSSIEPVAGTFEWIGGATCLDFTNTVTWRTDGVCNERLATFDDLVVWSVGAGLLTREDARAARPRGIASGRGGVGATGGARSETVVAPHVHACCDAPLVAGTRNRPVQPGIGADVDRGTSRSCWSAISLEIRA
jgi:hypothetical protein